MITISPSIIDDTLAQLAIYGKGRKEIVVLWLAKKEAGHAVVQRVYVPLQETGRAFFRIPPKGMRLLFEELRKDRLMVAAQVHTHPMEAFHSWADDTMAVIKHAGALSLVLPYFARETTAANFVEQTKVFSLSKSNEWDEITFNQEIAIR
ncbi:MAG: Mov34/MPN/PAD-1 family protein [Opitutae bacterium]|nr:Mov34/MPN/PAD-1 family protein [Opitutae bacterium]